MSWFHTDRLLFAQSVVTFARVGGALLATITLQLCLQLFPLYTTFFLNSYIGQLGFVLLLLLYFYLFTPILLFSAEVNAFFGEGIHVPKSDLITQASKGSYK